MKSLIVRGGSIFDDVFSIVTYWGEELNLNVTKLQFACNAGRFGAVRYAPTDGLPPADWSQWGEGDRATVDAIKKLPEILNKPAIAIGSPTDDGPPMLCFADGQHRVTARQELGLPEIAFFIVPWEEIDEYRVTYEEVDL